jgi:integrase
MGSIYKQRWKDKDGTVHESNIWWIKYYRDGKPIRESSESEKESEAKKLLKLREGDVARGIPVAPKYSRVTIDELLTDLETEYQVNERDTLSDLKGRLWLHIRPYFGGRRAAAITTAYVRSFISKRQQEGASNGEINRELSAVKRAYNLAVQGGKLIHRPYIPMLKENNVRKSFFELEQFEDVRRHLPEHLRPVVTFAYITGWRIRSEVLSLRWDQVDSQAEVVRLEAGTTKNEEPREFPYTDEPKDLLEAQGEKSDSLLAEKGIVTEHVFFRADGRRIRDFRRAWRKACKKAGIAEEQEIGKTKKGKPIVKITPLRIPHDFRRTAVRNLVRAGVHERLAMQMTGHKTRSVFERYNVTSGADLKEAAKKLNQFFKNAHGHESGHDCTKSEQPAQHDLPVTPSESMPGMGIKEVCKQLKMR